MDDVKENNSPNKNPLLSHKGLSGKSTALLVEKMSKTQKMTLKSSATYVGTDNYSPSMSEEVCYKPSPADFVNYLPWAAGELAIGKFINIKVTNLQEEIFSRRDRHKHKASPQVQVSEPLVPKDSEETSIGLKIRKEEIVDMEVTFRGSHLVQIKFCKNKDIPRKLLKIITLIVEFYPNLEKIVIERGLTSYSVHEISNLLPISNITEVILDNCFVIEANFHILLDRRNSVKNLSLARCAIGDKATKEICEKLVYPLPASSTLVMLNLSSNRISDSGATHIAKFLRTNRRLKYLNLADNRLTNAGAKKIISTLMPFPINEEERLAFKQRYLNYLKIKAEITKQIFSKMLSSKLPKRRVVKTQDDKKKGKVGLKKVDSESEMAYVMERAESAAVEECGEFIDPYSESNTTLKGDTLYSNGNFALIYLNLAYNNLGVMTLSELVKVFEYQTPTACLYYGITSVTLEGNPMPKSCMEYKKLEVLIEKRLAETNKLARISNYRKRLTNVK